ncbi:serine/threonine-protein kinase [Lentisphaerota bacterium ZTH]|nr:serine/threonine protein kinase [Lentisphaerota bacterium]WET05360.1 serine/threonine-protein kinase [Lentisphaerota bacterium ZTH]
MSTFRFKCPHCSQKLEAEDTMFGSLNVCPECNKEFQVPDSRLSAGVEIGDYILRKRIGSGGMGEVWLAEQQSMGRDVALKVMRSELSKNPEFVRRFQKEIFSSGKMLHNNIVTAFHSGCENGVFFMAMEYVKGETLEQRLQRSALPEAEALKVVTSVAKALKFAWDNFKIIHRDIKPSNIMLSEDGAVKLLDLGISRSFAPGNQMTTLTGVGLLIGTPHYMSPEQAENKPDIDCRADIYTLGIVLCEMLTGKPPFDAPASVEIIAQHIFAPRPDLRLAGASGNVSKLAAKMLAVNRKERFADWDEVLNAIRCPDSIKGAVLHRRLLPKALTLLAGCFIVLLIGLVAMHLHSSEKKRNSGNRPPGDNFQGPPEGGRQPGRFPPPPREDQQFNRHPNGDDGDRQRNPGRRDSMWLKDMLVLNDKQLEAVKNVTGKARLDIQEARVKFTESGSTDTAIIKQQTKKIKKKLTQDLKKILNDEQFKKFERYRPMIFTRLNIQPPPEFKGKRPGPPPRG